MPLHQFGERGPIFDEIPSGPTIMDWFLDKTLAREWVGCGGDADYILSWDPESGTGSHLDLIAHVDHDAAWYWLLCVGTHQDNEPTTYDLLFVSADLNGARTHQWRNDPSTAQPWHHEGLVWFAGQITDREDADRAARNCGAEPEPRRDGENAHLRAILDEALRLLSVPMSEMDTAYGAECDTFLSHALSADEPGKKGS